MIDTEAANAVIYKSGKPQRLHAEISGTMVCLPNNRDVCIPTVIGIYMYPPSQASLLRSIVAGPRSRHPEAGLDLCYVTDNSKASASLFILISTRLLTF